MDTRFEVLKVENLGKAAGDTVLVYILRDKETGILYMHNTIGGGACITGGITPIIDKDGKPVRKVICLECGYELSDTDKTCPECGCPQ